MSSPNTQATNILNEIIQNVSYNSSNVCKSMSSNSQVINIGNITGIGCSVNISGVTQDITSKLNSTCLQSTDFSDMVAKAVDDKMNEVKNDSPELYGRISNIFKSNFNAQMVSSCMAETLNAQSLNIGDISVVCTKDGKITIENISQKIASDLMMNCVQTKNPVLMEKLDAVDKEIAAMPPVEKKTDYTIPIVVGTVIIVFLILLAIGLFLYFRNPKPVA